MLRIPASTSALLLLAATAAAQSTMTPLPTFGTNGWLAPGSSAFLTTSNTERGMAFNPATGNLVLVSRAGGNNVRILDGLTGNDLGGLDATGITGGTFPINMAGVDDAGAIYVCNLSTSATSNFKVYQWTSETAGATTPPTAVYDAASGTARTGDSFAVRGGAASPAQFAAAGSTASTTNSNSNFVVGALDGTNTSTAYLSVPGTGTASNDYRLSLSFVDADTLIGNQGGLARWTSFNGTTATVEASIGLGGSAQRALAYAVVGGTPVLAVIDSNSALVSIFDVSVPGAASLLVSANATTGTLTANANATGQVAWGPISGNTATLYAMNTNQGIQAFSVTIQPPASAKAFGVGCGTPAVTLSASAAPVLPSTIQLVVDNIPTTAPVGFLSFGFMSFPGGLPIPIAPGCQQYIVPLASNLFLPLGASSVQIPQSWPNTPAFAGSVLNAQAIVIDQPFNVLTSNGLRMYVETF